MASVTVTVGANTAGATRSMEQLQERVAALRSEVLSTSTPLSLFGGAIVPIAGAATSVALQLGAAAGAVGVFGAAVLPQFQAVQAASAAGDKAAQAQATAARKTAEAQALATKGGKDYKTALSAAAAASRAATDAEAAYQQQLKGLPPTTRSVAEGFVKLKGDFKAWSDNLAPHTMPVFLSGLNIIDGLLPKLAPLAANVGDQFAALGKKLEHAADSPKFDKLVTEFSDFAAHALADVIRGVEDLAGWLARGFQSQGFHDFLQQGKQDGPQIVQMLKTLVEFVGKFISASQGMDQIEFKALATVVNLLNKIPQGVLKILAPTILGIAAAVKLWAIAQGLLDVLLADNPLGATLVALTAVGIALYEAYQHSEAFRKAVDALAWAMGDVLLSDVKSVLPVIKLFADTVMNAMSMLLHGMADLGGWIPGVGSKIKALAKDLDQFHGSFDSTLNAGIELAAKSKAQLDDAMSQRKLGVDISDWQKQLATAKATLNSVPASKRADVLANIADLQKKIANAQGLLNSLHDKTVTVTFNGVAQGTLNGHSYTSTTGFSYAAGGAVTAAASGGGRSGMVLVGEQGPELVRLPGGSSVVPAGQTAAMLGAGGGVQRLELVFSSGGSEFDDMIVHLLRRYIRGQGGNVQLVLGQRG